VFASPAIETIDLAWVGPRMSVSCAVDTARTLRIAAQMERICLL